MQLRPPPSVLPMALMCPHSSGRDKRERFLKHTPGTLTWSLLFLAERETLGAMDQKAPAAALLLGTGTRRAWGASAPWEAAAQLHREVASAQRGGRGARSQTHETERKVGVTKGNGPSGQIYQASGETRGLLGGDANRQGVFGPLARDRLAAPTDRSSRVAQSPAKSRARRSH